MRRRDVLAALPGAAAAWPVLSRAEPSTLPIVGCLGAPAEATYRHHVAAIRQGLGEAGFIEGQNVLLEFRWAEGQYDRLPGLAAELVRRPVNVIITMGGGPPIRAARSATSTVPIVFHLGADPVSLGLVESFNRPGGNVTGITLMTNSMELKRLELLLKMVPGVRSLGVLANPANASNASQARQLQDAALRGGLTLAVTNASTTEDLDAGFAGMAARGIDALTVLSDVFFTSNSARIAGLAERHRIATIAHSREFADAGGLMSYGTNLTDAYRWTGIYAGRILKGESPAELPVIEPTRFDFLINMRAARTLGLTVPPELLVAADEVIE